MFKLEEFYIYLKVVRKRFGWSQAQMAKELGVTRLTVHKWEQHGRKLVDIGTFRSKKQFYQLKKLHEIANMLHEYRAKKDDWDYLYPEGGARRREAAQVKKANEADAAAAREMPKAGL